MKVGWMAFSAIVGLSGCVGVASAKETPLIPREVLFGNPEKANPQLSPDGDKIFKHTTEGEDDMPAHIRTSLTSVNLAVPIVAGAMALGTWQGIYVWEHRTHPHRRQLAVHLLGE